MSKFCSNKNKNVKSPKDRCIANQLVLRSISRGETGRKKKKTEKGMIKLAFYAKKIVY